MFCFVFWVVVLSLTFLSKSFPLRVSDSLNARWGFNQTGESELESRQNQNLWGEPGHLHFLKVAQMVLLGSQGGKPREQAERGRPPCAAGADGPEVGALRGRPPSASASPFRLVLFVELSYNIGRRGSTAKHV